MKNSHIAFILSMIACFGLWYLFFPLFHSFEGMEFSDKLFLSIIEGIIVLLFSVMVSVVFLLIFDFGHCESCYKLTYTKAHMFKTTFFCQHCQDTEKEVERVKEVEELAKEKEAITKKLENERIIPCPHCHIAMKKEVIEGKIIVDKCETHGIWLDDGELTRLKKSMKGRVASSSSYSSSDSSDGGSNFALGIAVGMAIN